jgi:hypothetical protein
VYHKSHVIEQIDNERTYHNHKIYLAAIIITGIGTGTHKKKCETQGHIIISIEGTRREENCIKCSFTIKTQIFTVIMLEKV